jgi:glycosyltransferase involved in cell wall biosynthesis
MFKKAESPDRLDAKDGAFMKSDIAPLLTVALPVFNAGTFLKLAVLSIINQTFCDWELLIIDDGSTDDSLNSISGLSDARIHILRDGLNKGLPARLNEAIDLASGKYFARMDQDDVSFPERFSRQIKYLQDEPQLDVVAVQSIGVSYENEIISLLPCPLDHEEICARPWQGFCFPHPTWLGRTEWFLKHRYSTYGTYCCEDDELMLRSYRNSRFGAIDEFLFAYRMRSIDNWARIIKARWAFFKNHCRHFANTRQLHFVMFTSGVFLALVARDLFRMVRQMLGLPRYNPVNVKPEILSLWLSVINDDQNNQLSQQKAAEAIEPEAG